MVASRTNRRKATAWLGRILVDLQHRRRSRQMIANSPRFVKMTVRTATALAALVATACVPQYMPPQQVAASNPTVTYKYYGDQELIQANQQAAAFCAQYQSAPRTAGFSNDPDGRKVVIFECVQMTGQLAAPQQYSPNLSYNYRTDPELLEASRNAQVYCMNSGSQPVVSNIGTSANGTRIVTFQCGRP
jgi:hypothetical protein